jgi:putative DNA primase/helicase
MAAANYDDVLDQLRSAGLIVERLEVGTPRPVRCKVEGDREKRGWYSLHELQAPGGDLLIVGSFGVWRGNDNTAQKIELRKREISQEQRDALRKRLAEDKRRADEQRRREAARAADTAAKAWAALSEDGDADYLAAKHVGAYGLRFTKHGSAVLPLLDTAGRIHGLQFLRTAAQAKEARRPAKEFWPTGLVKKGHFHLIGSPDWCVLVAEGYATAASLHMATGKPVAVAFDAGNLLPVAEALRKRYPRTKILICADDDAFSEGNPGITSASAAAMAVHGAWVAPQFADEDARRALAEKGTKRTDFNDLHAAEGLHVVRVQVEARLSALGWAAQLAGAATSANGGQGSALRAIQTLDELLKRFALVYAHSGTVFDRREHCLLSLSDMRDACIRRDVHRAWMEHPDRAMVRVEEVGFDPGEDDPQITCNLWGGWPTTAKAGKCEKLLELLRYVCSDDRNKHVFEWVLRWLAYPIQHPGAKMKSTLVLHGPQGTGKNLFFETVMAIYGKYGRVIGQDAVEDKFNDWASRKLFLIADEVAARSEVYHLKNKLKALITGDWIRINPKNIAAYDERNHVNLVFLSNEAMPVALEEDDRRHCVVWTPPERDRAFYAEVLAEIADGGAAALHDYLLNLDLGDFHNGTRPPETAAKDELIGLGLDSPQRFWDDVHYGELPGIRAVNGLAVDWYEAYKRWCQLSGHRSAPMPKFLNALARKRNTPSQRKRYLLGQTTHGPHAVLMMGGGDPPEGEAEQSWLGDAVAEFRKRLSQYKGAGVSE